MAAGELQTIGGGGECGMVATLGSKPQDLSHNAATLPTTDNEKSDSGDDPREYESIK